MNRSYLLLLGLPLLAACGAANPGSGSGRPDLPTGIEVRFPAAPANAYLSLLTEEGKSIYQLSVPAGQTSIEVDSVHWQEQSAAAQPVEAFLPAGVSATVTPVDAKVNLLHWSMWQDKNANGTRDDGETLDLMTHDRVAYASQAVKVDFTAASMHQVWNLAQGWSRAEHYVYLPTGSTTYQRQFSTNPVERYELHVTTPVTSQ